MITTRVFQSGNSQAVRLPKDFQFDNDVVEIIKHNNEVILRPIPKNLSEAFEWFKQFPEDVFAEKRKDTPPQKRDFF